MSKETRDLGFGIIEVFDKDTQYAPAQSIKIGNTTYIREDLVHNQIAELQKQLEEKTKTIEGLVEEQKNIENSASYQMFLDCQNTIENYRKATKELWKEYDKRV